MISYVVNRPEGRGPNLDEMDEDEREARIERMRARFGDRADEMIERRQARDANQIRVQILDENDKVVSTIQGPAEPGLNRVSWNLRQQAPQRPGQRGQSGGGFAARFARRGPLAVPGDYTVKISVGRESSTARLRVVPDPRTPVTPEAILARSNFVKRARDDMQIAFQATARLTSTRDRIREVTQKLSGLDDKEHARELQGQARKLQGEIRVLQEMFSGNRDVQGIRRDPNVITSGFFFLMRSSGWEAPSASEQVVLEQAEARLQKGLIKVNEFFEKSFPPFQKAVEKADLPLFESHKPLTLPVTTTPSGGKGR